jgi:chromosome segregation ATPase
MDDYLKARLETLEKDLQEIKDVIKNHTSDITALKESQAETRVYVKQIFERIEDLKTLFKTNVSTTSNANDKWMKVVLELIKAIGTIAAIIAGIKILG